MVVKKRLTQPRSQSGTHKLYTLGSKRTKKICHSIITLASAICSALLPGSGEKRLMTTQQEDGSLDRFQMNGYICVINKGDLPSSESISTWH